MAEEVVRLGQFESKEIVALAERLPGSYNQRLGIAGNSILSTVFLKACDPGASVLVEYFDYGVGFDDGEEFALPKHDLLTIPLSTSRILISQLHNKPAVRCTVVGGNASFGVYATIVSSSASDTDNSLQRELDPVNLLSDKGMPTVIYDEAAGVWRFARGVLGVQDVRPVGNTAVVDPGSPTFVDASSATTPGVEQTLISYTVPPSFALNLLSMQVICRMESRFEIYGDGTLIGSGRTGAAIPQVNFAYRVARTFVTGKLIELKLTTRTGSPVTNCEAYLQGTLSPN